MNHEGTKKNKRVMAGICGKATFELFVSRMPERYPPDAGYADMAQLELEDIPRLTAELLRRGYAEKEIRGILGENWLRVCGEVWK